MTVLIIIVTTVSVPSARHAFFVSLQCRFLQLIKRRCSLPRPLEGAGLETITEDARSRRTLKRIKEIHGVVSADNELRSPNKLPDPPGQIQREAPKIGSRDAPGG